MDVADVMAEIGSKLETIDGLRVFPYDVAKIPPPGAVVALPESVDFDATYGRGSDEMTIPVFVMVARTDSRSAHLELGAYLNGSGTKSVKAVVDSTNSNTYTACDTVTVTRAEPGYYTSGGVEMLGAEFTVHITGTGS